MTIPQLSVFIENRSGTMIKVLRVLKDAGIQIIASTVSDTVDFGIYRIICSDPASAMPLLKENGLSVTLSEVFAVELDNTPGQASEVMEAFSDAGISISYMYSFLVHGKGILIFRTSDEQKTREVIRARSIDYVSSVELRKLSEEA